MAQPRFGLKLICRTTPANRRELLQTLQALQAALEAEAPVTECELFEDLVIPNRFLWTEWWPEKLQLESSLQSERFETLRAAVEVLGTLESLSYGTTSEDLGRSEGFGPPAPELRAPG